jgi:hypothetical protein
MFQFSLGRLAAVTALSIGWLAFVDTPAHPDITSFCCLSASL